MGYGSQWTGIQTLVKSSFVKSSGLHLLTMNRFILTEVVALQDYFDNIIILHVSGLTEQVECVKEV